MLAHAELTDKVIRAAMEIHSARAPGFSEAVYEEAKAVEFEQGGFRLQRLVAIPVQGESRLVGEHRLDFLVGDAEARTYLKATGPNAGLLLNFPPLPLTFKRAGREVSGRARSFQTVFPAFPSSRFP